MAVNFARKYKKFYEHIKRMIIEYRQAGMPEENIREMVKFDLNQFARDLAYERRTQPLHNYDGDFDADEQSPLLLKFFGALTVGLDEYEFYSEWWLDNIESVPLSEAINKLCAEKREILTRYYRNGEKKYEIAKSKGVSPQALGKKFNNTIDSLRAAVINGSE